MQWSFLNPFHGIRELDTLPHTRTLRTGLWQKTKDTFWVFAGTANHLSTHPAKDEHMGILDWLTLGIPLALQALYANIALISNPIVRYPLSGILWIVVGALTLARYAIAATATAVAFFPIIVPTYLLSSLAGSDLKEKAMHLPISSTKQILNPAEDPEGKGRDLCKITMRVEQKTLGQHIQDEKIGLDNLEIKDVSVSSLPSGDTQLTLNFYRKEFSLFALNYEEEFGSGEMTRPLDFSYTTVFTPNKLLDTSKQEGIQAIQAVFDLNIGHVTEKLEKSHPEIMAHFKK